MSYQKATDFIKPHLKEAIKTHAVYDGNDRLIEFYEAVVDAIDGAPCLLTEYTYITPTSGLVENSKESISAWDAAWDI